MLTQSTHISLLARLGQPDDPPEYARAWTEFQARYGELIRRFAMRRGLQAADCDDVLQDTVMALGRSMPGFEYDAGKGTFRAYLKTVVSHIISRKMRQNNGAGELHTRGRADVHNDLPGTEPDLEALWESEWRRYHLNLAMHVINAEFNEADRTAFTHYALEGRDAKETAQLLGISIDQVYQAKSRIARRLSELIDQQVAEEG